MKRLNIYTILKISLLFIFFSFGSLTANESENTTYDYGLEVTFNVLVGEFMIDNSTAEPVGNDENDSLGLFGYRQFRLGKFGKLDAGLTFEFGEVNINPNTYDSGDVVTYPENRLTRYGAKLRLLSIDCNPNEDSFWKGGCTDTFFDDFSFFISIHSNYYHHSLVTNLTDGSSGTKIYLDNTVKGFLFEYGLGFTYKLSDRWKLVLASGYSTGSVDVITNHAYTDTGVVLTIDTLKASIDNGSWVNLGASYSF